METLLDFASTAGCWTVMQWMLPPPTRTLRVGTATTLRSGNVSSKTFFALSQTYQSQLQVESHQQCHRMKASQSDVWLISRDLEDFCKLLAELLSESGLLKQFDMHFHRQSVHPRMTTCDFHLGCKLVLPCSKVLCKKARQLGLNCSSIRVICTLSQQAPGLKQASQCHRCRSGS